MSGILLQYACWTYLPDFATRQVLSVIHRVFSTRAPPPRSPGYVRHYRYAYAAVVLCYLTYNFMHASSGLGKNYYELLGVNPHSDEGGLKAAFRAFARRHHPDRAGPGGEALFMDVRDAFEALKDPVIRFAYDRFGPDVLGWQECTTMKDYMRRGLMNWMLRHVMTGVGLFLITVVGKRSRVAAWRYLLFLGVFGLELYLIVAPWPIPSTGGGDRFVDAVRPEWGVLEGLFPQRVAYQHILLLHEVFLFVSVAVSRVAPVLFGGVDGETEGRVVGAMGARIGELSKTLEREVWTMLDAEVRAVDGVGLRRGMVLREMEEMVVENTLRREAPMGSAWDGAVQRGRARSRSL